jgi:hypothetical protein
MQENCGMVTHNYIGSALCFPINGRDEVGMSVTIDVEDLVLALEEHPKITQEEGAQLVINILPLKPENITDKKTHSVKLINVKKYDS